MTITRSRLGKKPVSIPSGVEVKLQERLLHIKGPKGQLSWKVNPFIQIAIADGKINVSFHNTSECRAEGAHAKLSKSILGTARARIANMVSGVDQGFEKKLALVGVGFRAQAKGKVLSLNLGYSHPVEVSVPAGITIETPSQTEIIVKGADKEQVGQVAAEIREKRSPEPYKGKGVRYADEVIEIKETKKK